MPSQDHEITALLERWRAGSSGAEAKLDSRQAEIVEARYFGGLTIDEIADLTHLSPATLKREWAFARLWLRRHMRGVAAS